MQTQRNALTQAPSFISVIFCDFGSLNQMAELTDPPISLFVSCIPISDSDLFSSLNAIICNISSEKLSWLPILGDFFIHHFFPSLLYYNETEDFTDLYSCRRVNKWFRAHLNPPRVRLTPSKFRSFDRMRTIAPVVEKLICMNFSDALNMTRLIESPFFSTAAALRTLQFVSGPNLKTGAVKVLCNNLSRIRSLTFLDMIGVDCFSPSRQDILAAVAVHPSITRLTLPRIHWNTNDPEKVALVGEQLSYCTRLERLSLSLRAVGWNADTRCLFRGLEKLHHLKYLEFELADISWNGHAIQPEQFPETIHSFLQATKNLKTFRFTPGIRSVMSVDDFFRGLQGNTTIRNLKVTSLGSLLPSFAAEAFRKNPPLTSLDLSGCNLHQGILPELSDAILEIKTLTRLNLSGGSHVPRIDVHAFSESLSKNSTLRTLIISRAILLESAAMVPLVRAVADHPALTKLDLSKNGSDRETMVEFGICLRKNTTLISLNLSDVCHSCLEAALLFQGLEDNRSLRRLDISFNTIGPDDYMALVQMLRRNQDLVFLGMRSLRFAIPGSLAELFKAVDSNKSLSLLDLRESFIKAPTGFPFVIHVEANQRARVLH
jgi:hypothetical protein